MKKSFFCILLLTLFLSGCGGGGSDNTDNSPVQKTPPSSTGNTETKAPKVTSFNLNDTASCIEQEKCVNVISVEVDAEITGAKFQLSGAQAEVVFGSDFTTVLESGEVSFNALKSFTINLTNQEAGDIKVEILSISDSNGTYDVSEQSVIVSFDEKPVEVASGLRFIHFNDLNGATVSLSGEQNETNILASEIIVERYKKNEQGSYDLISESPVTLNEGKVKETLPVGHYRELITAKTSFATLQTSAFFEIPEGGLANNHLNLFPVGVTSEEIAKQKEAFDAGEHNLFTYYQSDFAYNWLIKKPRSVKYNSSIEVEVFSFILTGQGGVDVEFISNLPFKLKLKNSNFEADINEGANSHTIGELTPGTNTFSFELSNFNSGGKALEFETRVGGYTTKGSYSETAIKIDIVE